MNEENHFRRDDYEDRKEILRQTELMILSYYTEGVGSRRWVRRFEFKERLGKLVEEFWQEYKRTPEEEKEQASSW